MIKGLLEQSSPKCPSLQSQVPSAVLQVPLPLQVVAASHLARDQRERV